MSKFNPDDKVIVKIPEDVPCEGRVLSVIGESEGEQWYCVAMRYMTVSDGDL